MIKKIFDFFFSIFVLILLLPVFMVFLIIVFLHDFSNPIYLAPRIGKNKKKFNCYKIRTMVKNADKSGVFSTSDSDNRITKIGAFLRKTKIDELLQLINVIKFEMSVVGPRPNVEEDVKKYTNFENNILSVRPGITDFSSIVFSDEGEILKNSLNPDKDYNLLIRPWKSRLALLYIENQNFLLDVWIIILTVINFLKRDYALYLISKCVSKFRNVEDDLVEIILRKKKLKPHLPPGINA